MQKILVGIMAGLTVLLAFLCVVLSTQLIDARQRAMAAEAARTAESESRNAQTARLRELERVNRRLEQQVQEFASVTTRLRTNEARQTSNLQALAERIRASQRGRGNDATNGDEREGIFGKGMGEALGRMMKDPAMREMVREQQKATISLMYSGLIKDLNLSPDETEKLKAVLTDAQMRNVEAAQGLFGGTLEGTAADTQKQFMEAKQQTDAEIKALLGEERFAQYEDYQKNMQERMQLDQFKNQLAGENLPLEDSQMAQLLQAMKEEKSVLPPAIPMDQTQMPTKETFTADNLDKQMKWMTEYNRRVRDRAAQILSPEQFKQYEAFQEQQASMQKLGLNMARQMFGGDRVASPPPTPPAP